MSPSTGTLVPARARAGRSDAVTYGTPAGIPGIRSILTAVGRVNVAPARTNTAFLLDDHKIVRRGLRELLESIDDLLVVGESGLAQDAARRSH